jgi:hypothetical protein
MHNRLRISVMFRLTAIFEHFCAIPFLRMGLANVNLDTVKSVRRQMKQF